MTSSIAFVGAGPTTLYTLSALISRRPREIEITIFEEQPTAGLGSPYRPGWNDPAMLSNIASIEIPPLAEPLIGWLERQPSEALLDVGIDPEQVDERAFVPRVALGRYFRDQFDRLVDTAKAEGMRVEIATRCRVIDAENLQTGVLLTLSARNGSVHERLFDHVVLATGHQWPSKQEVRPGYFLSPWPAEALAKVAPVEIGIRGSSLTAIDAAVALAGSHGVFVRGDGGLTYEPAPAADGFRLTMMSRKGLLPEADYFFPLPHRPLSICTPDAIQRLIAESDDLLEDAFDLFRRELMQIDPDYAEATELRTATLEAFCENYFAERSDADPFEWAQANLAEAQRNHEDEVTVGWRDAILRMHDVLAAIVPHLDGREFQRFSRHFKPIFVDGYGAVPHESIERLLALRRAGRLEVVALGDDYRIDTHRAEGGVVLHLDGERRHFPVFIEATGQRPLSAIQFPFLTLLEQGVIRDEISPDAPGVVRGIVMNDRFHPVAPGLPEGRLFCLSLPFIMGRHPFVQGITSSHEMGEIVGEELAKAVGARTPVAEAA